ncbi:MAG: Fpg/Nei family DNA glycosylase [Hyphomicrobiales bacterium]
MPELPFLEVLAENLAAGVVGRRIEAIEIRQPALLMTATPAPESFAGEFLSHPSRKGKYLIFETESRRAIVIHLMRLGRLQIASASPAAGAKRGRGAKPGAGAPKNLSARVRLDDGTELRLIEHGTEKRARLWLAEDADALPEIEAVGPDPTRGEIDAAGFLAALRAASRQLKTFLTDQRAISGIGNGLSDEILHAARLSPLQLTKNVADEAAARLFEAVGDVLARQTDLLRASAAGALPQKEPVEHYAVHDHAGERCARCGSTIARVSYADHETFYCPGCQTGGAPLKDRRMSKLLK